MNFSRLKATSYEPASLQLAVVQLKLSLFFKAYFLTAPVPLLHLAEMSASMEVSDMKIVTILVLCFSIFTPAPVLSAEMSVLDSTEHHLDSNEPANGDIRNFDFVDIPNMRLKGFLDLGFRSTLRGHEDNTTFSIGQLNFHITSKLSENTSFFAEMFFANPENNSASLFINTRAVLRYSLTDLFNIAIGQMHTPLGYWNAAYHHGTWLQTTITRPEIHRYDRAYIPIHSFGIEFSGIKYFTDFNFEYSVSVLNGRGRVPPGVVRVKDENGSKAVNLNFAIKPTSVEGLMVGANLYNDKIPPDPGNPLRVDSITERITGGYVIYRGIPTEFLGEFFFIYHDDQTSMKVYNTTGFYLQAGYRIGDFMPYFRYDAINFGEGDPYYSPNAIDVQIFTPGLRWDVSMWNALKLEYRFEEKDQMEDEQTIEINSSFTF